MRGLEEARTACKLLLMCIVNQILTHYCYSASGLVSQRTNHDLASGSLARPPKPDTPSAAFLPGRLQVSLLDLVEHCRAYYNDQV